MNRTHRYMARHGDEGTVLVLVLGFAMVLVVMVGVVVNVSAAVLARRAVASAADGAAVAAAQALDEDAVRNGGLSGRLPLSQSGARQRVAAYARQVAPTQPGLRLTVTVDGSTASVVAVRDVRLPFARLVGLRPLRVEATGRARAPVSP